MINNFLISLFILIILLLVIIFNNKQKFECSQIPLTDWEPHGITHKDCIHKCYNETLENSNDEDNSKITDILEPVSGNTRTGFHYTDIGHIDDLTFENDVRTNSLQGRKIDLFLDKIWKNIPSNSKNKYSNCFKKCFDCSVADCDFKQNNISISDKSIILNVIPDNESIALIWKLNFSDVVDQFIITIKDKTHSDIVKTIPINNEIKNKNLYNYTIKNLINNNVYLVNVNCIFKDGQIRHSNSVEVTPSNISIVNFNELKDLRKMKETRNESILESIKGKIFNINIS